RRFERRVSKNSSIRNTTDNRPRPGCARSSQPVPEAVTPMTTTDRRTFLRLLGGASLAAAFPASIRRALAVPAHRRTGTIDDVEHVVFLMQENRAFDHYFGTLRGVRGFGDPRPMSLPSGRPVWFQPDGNG